MARTGSTGGYGADVMTGGANSDVFVFSGGKDKIIDFKVGADSLVILDPYVSDDYAEGDLTLLSKASFNAYLTNFYGDVDIGKHALLCFSEDDALTLAGLDYLVVASGRRTGPGTGPPPAVGVGRAGGGSSRAPRGVDPRAGRLAPGRSGRAAFYGRCRSADFAFPPARAIQRRRTGARHDPLPRHRR